MKKYGILAYPAAHSKSPQMHNAAFEFLQIPAIFERYEIAPEQLPNFFTKNLQDQRNIAGLAVSVPYKETVAQFLDQIDDSAKKIGAVNTIYWKGNMLCGTNTDWIGFSRALKEYFFPEGKKILVLGAGGAARAIVYALLQEGADQIIVVNRTSEKAQHLAVDFGVQWKQLSELRAEEYHLVINTTVLGMQGKYESFSPLPKDFWKSHLTAFDVVYTPLQTKFLQEAAQAGAKIISGEKMLLLQGMEQFVIWTGEQAPQKIMTSALV